ncbi:MAG: hypothetical protein GC136_10985 [Alphaproteobacteria bacterium]|nr:hypothetical protein [Alphaproteobacteria bacterium]
MKTYTSQDIIAIAVKAAQEAIRLRSLGLEIETKADGSRVTNADLEADVIITKGLRALNPDIEIISEEGKNKHPNGAYDDAWVIDPIDGTNAFINYGNSFAVLIARVENHVPVEGVAYYPVRDVVYYTDGQKSYRRKVTVNEEGEITMGSAIELSIKPVLSQPVRYSEFKTNVLDGRLTPEAKVHSFKQAVSILAILDNDLDVASYLATMGDWDLAALDAILRSAGGGLVSASLGRLLEYGTHRTPDFAFMQVESIAGELGTLMRLGLADKEAINSAPARGA